MALQLSTMVVKNIAKNSTNCADSKCFFAVWAVRKSALDVKHDRLKSNSQNQRLFTHFDVQRGSANQQTSFSRRGNVLKKYSFWAHCQQALQTHYSLAKHRRPYCKEDERSSLPCFSV